MRHNKKTDNLLTKECFGLDKYSLLAEKIDADNNSFAIYVAKNIREKMNIPIYRYMKYEYLVQLLIQKKLFVSNKQKFTDLREHSEYIFKSMNESKHVLSEFPSYKNRTFCKNREEQYSQIWKQPVSCWTYGSYVENMSENYLMWKCHMGNGLVCRIRSSVQKFAESIKELNNDIIISDVEYVPILRFHIVNIPSDIFKKPIPYIGEQEIRFVVLHNSIQSCMEKDNVSLVVDPTILIDEIMLSPFVGYEEERIMMERLQRIMGEKVIPVKRSALMERV